MRRSSLVVIAASTLLAVLVAVFVNLATDEWEPWTIVILVVLVVATIMFESRRAGRSADVPSTSRPDLAAAAAQLTEAVGKQWRREFESRLLHDPRALELTWCPADVPMDHWERIAGLARTGVVTGPTPLTGRPNRLIDVYHRLPLGRLVVLGDAGAGKTVLMLMLVLDLLDADDRRPTDPVPVVFSVGSWNPVTATLRQWLTDQLVRDHPGLAAIGSAGSTMAAALVESDRILPILDGFDEIGAGLHRAAIQAINQFSPPVLLTSRPREYLQAMREADVLSAAPVIELRRLQHGDVADYLRLSARPDTAGGTVWDPVLSHLSAHPDSNLAAVLSNPLMVTMARTIYSDLPDRDPSKLLDTVRFDSQRKIEDHLLENYVPAAYSHTSSQPRWEPDRASRWLSNLAAHLTNRNTHDLAWWELGTILPRLTRGLVVAFTIGVTIILVISVLWDSIITGVVIGLPIISGIWLAIWLGVGFAGRLTIGAVIGFLFGIILGPFLHFANGWIVGGPAYGLLLGLAMGLTSRGEPEPSRVRLRIGRLSRRAQSQIRWALLYAFLVDTAVLVAAWPESQRLTVGEFAGVSTLALSLGTIVAVFEEALRASKGHPFWARIEAASRSTPIRSGIAFGAIFATYYVLWPGHLRNIVGIVGASLGMFILGFLFGFAIGLVVSILRAFETPIDIDAAISPPGLLKTDRKSAIFQSFALCAFIALLIGLLVGSVDTPGSGLTAGLLLGTVFGLVRLSGTAWGRWLIVVRIWLPLTGRLPWAVMGFLEDAHRRGVLRQAGAVYQFRHSRLRDRLARTGAVEPADS